MRAKKFNAAQLFLFHRHQRIEFPVLSFYDNKSSDLEVFVNVER